MKSIAVMIVDDEKIVIKNLLQVIDWEKHGFHVAATAYNGKLGVHLYKEVKPLVILTDVRMPIMDGIQMMHEIRSIDSSVHFLVLSAYGEFEYARQAIDLRANAYLLKDSINPDSLLEAMLEIKSQIEKEAEAAYGSIYDLVTLFVKGLKRDMAGVLQNLDDLFGNLTIETDEWEVASLAERVSFLIEKWYRDYGKIEMFSGPEAIDKETLLQWLQAQVRVIDRWTREELQSNYSHDISKAIMYIENNYSDKNLDIQKIAENLMISSSWLSTKFRNETGLTVNNYITKVRIEKAKELLQNGRYKVYEVAEQVGYGSSQYFSKLFYQETNQPPKNFRKDPMK